MRKPSNVISIFLICILITCLSCINVNAMNERDKLLGSFVESAYNIVYNRKSDFNGFSYWYENLSNGNASAEKFIKKFVLESPEFSNTTKVKRDFIEKIYRFTLGRVPDEEGINYFENLIDDLIIKYYKNNYPKSYTEQEILILRWDINQSKKVMEDVIDQILNSEEFREKVNFMNIKLRDYDKISIDDRTDTRVVYSNVEPDIVLDKYAIKEKQSLELALKLKQVLKNRPVEDTLENRILAYLGDNVENVAVSFYDIRTKESISINGDILFKAGSTYKVPLNIVLYDLVQAGKIDLDSTVTYIHSKHFEGGAGLLQSEIQNGYLIPQKFKDLSRMSLLNSDNIAANMLISGISQYTNLYGEYGKILGYQLNRIGNLFSTNDMMKFLKKIYFNEDNNPYYYNMLTFLRDSSKNIRIGRHIPEGIVFNKYGSFGENYHDIGIVLGDNPFIVSIFTRDVENAEKIIADISKMMYER